MPEVAEARAEGSLLRIVPLRSADLEGTLRVLRTRNGFNGVRRTGSSIVVAAREAAWLLEPGAAAAAGIRLSPGAERALSVRRRIAEVHESELQRLRALRDGGAATAREVLLQQGGRRLDILDDHQLVNVAAMTSDVGYGMCLFDEQGAGKTVTVIFAFDRLVDLNLLDTAVIVAPKSMVAEWAAELERFMGDLYRVAVVTGTSAQRRAAVRSGADVLVLNYEAVRTVEDDLILTLRRHPDRAVLVVDESYNVKNPEAQRTRDLAGIRDWFARAWVLCGTPAPNTAHDIVAQVDLVDAGQTFGEVDVPEDRAAALPVVQGALAARALYLRNLKANVLPDLPVKRFTTVRVPFAPQQLRLYRAALDSLTREVDAVTDVGFKANLANYLARRMTLLRIASNPIGIDATYTETPAKLGALDELLQTIIAERHDKAVVWSCFTASIDAIVARFARYGVVRYDGTVTTIRDRREAVRRFQRDPATALFVGNPAAAGAGLTLHTARYAIYESLSNQAAHYLQSLDRIHRRGQVRDVEYFVLMCDGAIEVLEYERLVAKERAASDLLRDGVDGAMTRSAFLADLRRARDLLGGFG